MYPINIMNITLSVESKEMAEQLKSDLRAGVIEEKLSIMINNTVQLELINSRLESIERLLKGGAETAKLHLVPNSIPERKESIIKLGKINNESIDTKSVLTAFRRF